MKNKSLCLFCCLSLCLLAMNCNKTFSFFLPETPVFQSQWHPSIDRPWAGPDYWLNPLQAWRQKAGQLRCETSGGDRNCVLLTQELTPKRTSFDMQVDLQLLSPEPGENTGTSAPFDSLGWVGFEIGKKGSFDDYRDDALYGKGFHCGITNQGQLFIGHLTAKPKTIDQALSYFKLRLNVQPATGEQYDVYLSCLTKAGKVLATTKRLVHQSWLEGLVALSCSQQASPYLDLTANRPLFDSIPRISTRQGGSTLYAFSKWTMGGDKFTAHQKRTFGPILWAQHTLSKQSLSLSAQFAPIGNDTPTASLEVDGKIVMEAPIDPLGRNALFRINDWDDQQDHQYAIVYQDQQKNSYRYEGIIYKDPTAKNDLVVASLSCVDDVGFPHQDVVSNVQAHQTDLILFHGDQIYERVGGYGVEHESVLDYLRKWYVWGWSFKELMRNQPTVIIPDDHDVFHGNLWGCGGKRADLSQGYGDFAQDDGGYKEPPQFVNMVHRTQCGHLPSPYDPTPVLNDISVYYTELLYGNVSFAILGDRQWKSAPKAFFPEAQIDNGWPQNKNWNPKTQAFHPDAELLGERQMQFLKDWAADWGNGTEFKTVVSQSPFCNVATLPSHIYHDRHVPKLERYPPGGYAPDDRPVADFDSNAWPKNKRDAALEVLRKAFSIHLVGDQHLGSTGQYGIAEYGDAGYWLATPAVANIWPRRWFPKVEPVGGRTARQPPYCGQYEDGFGNKISVKAISNPYDIDREPGRLFDKAPGYSIIRYDKQDRTTDLAVWPRWAGPGQVAPDNVAYAGWPIKVQQMDNFGQKMMGYLPEIEVPEGSYLQLISEADNELIYAIRPPASRFRAKVFDTNIRYRIRILSNDKQEVKVLSNLQAEGSE